MKKSTCKILIWIGSLWVILLLLIMLIILFPFILPSIFGIDTIVSVGNNSFLQGIQFSLLIILFLSFIILGLPGFIFIIIGKIKSHSEEK